MQLAHERAPDGFDDIEAVLPHAERAAIAAHYKQAAGFLPEVLNSRPSPTLPVSAAAGRRDRWAIRRWRVGC
jgi:hypothetical protein